MTALVIATHWPHLALGSPEHKAPDKVMHFVCFGLLTVLLWRTRWIPSSVSAGHVLICMIGLLIVVADEYTQSAAGIGREFSLADIGAGALGVGAAASFAGVWDRPRDGDATASHARRDMAVDVVMASPSTWLRSMMIGAVSIGIVSTAVWCLLWFGAGISNSNIALLCGLGVGGVLAWRSIIKPRYAIATTGTDTPPILPTIVEVVDAWRHRPLLCGALLVVAITGIIIATSSLTGAAASLTSSVVLWIVGQVMIWCWWVVDCTEDGVA